MTLRERLEKQGEKQEVVRCPICKSASEHLLSCPTRWYGTLKSS